MNLLWRKSFISGVGKAAVLMVASLTTKLLKACGCCPCGNDRWYVVGLCTCDTECGNVEPTFVGYDQTISISLNVIKVVPIDDVWTCITALMTALGQYDYNPINVGSIKYQAMAAPFDCSLSAEVWLDGVHKTNSDWAATGTTVEGSRPYIGDTAVDGGAYVHLFGSAHAFTAPGEHSVVLKITYTPLPGDEVNEETTYEVGASIACVVPEKSDENNDFLPYFGGISTLMPGPGDIWIIPERLMAATTTSCPWIGRREDIAQLYALQAYELRGPFDSFADAEFVENNWHDVLFEYANYCTCGGTGNPLSATNCDGEGAGSYELIGTPGDNEVFPDNPGPGWIVFEGGVVSQNGGTIEIRQFKNGVPDGVFASWSSDQGLEVWIPPQPCISYETWYVGHGVGDASAGLHGEWYGSSENHPCEVNWGDDIDGPVPNTSAELRAWEESQQAVNRLLAELPEGMA